MKTTSMQLAIITSVLAAILAGCGQRRDCVDQYGNVLPDTSCRGRTAGGYPHYIYGGTRSGGRVTGGSTTPRSSSSTSGGFGRGVSSSS
ncbi:MAG: hypothetical protein ABL962_10280 [Fimbriimonadaceae bacterium]